MNFFETVIGQRFINMLIKELPRLNDNLEKIIELKQSEKTDEK